MNDINDFEDKRKEKIGEQNETEGEVFYGQWASSPDSDNNSQENIDLELAGESELKTATSKSTQAERLIRLAHENATFFHTPSGDAFGCMKIGSHQEIWSLKSKQFKFLLRPKI